MYATLRWCLIYFLEMFYGSKFEEIGNPTQIFGLFFNSYVQSFPSFIYHSKTGTNKENSPLKLKSDTLPLWILFPPLLANNILSWSKMWWSGVSINYKGITKICDILFDLRLQFALLLIISSFTSIYQPIQCHEFRLLPQDNLGNG